MHTAHMQLARLQRRALALLAVAALACFGLLSWLGLPLWVAALGLVGVLAAHAFVLALEFLLLACLHRHDSTPRAGIPMLVRAWWTEVGLAVRVFGWRQPFRPQAVADVPGRIGVRGIVLVHGYVCNRGLWAPWLERCHAEGRPCMAIDLEPVFSPLDAYVPQIERAVAAMEAATGLPPLLVCHSMGGLVARAWMAATPGADRRIQRVVTLGTPHRGTWLACLSRTANGLHMRAGCQWLRQLEAREPPERARRFVCFYSNADNIVFPPRVAVLPGAAEHFLAGTPHVALAFHPEVYREVFDSLAQPATSEAGTKTVSRADA